MRVLATSLVALGLFSCSRPPAPTDTPEHRTQHAQRPIRTVYPYSLIAGGIESDEEFQQMRANDAVLRSHYADIDKLSEASTASDEWLYASYKRNGEVFWTSKRVHVAPKEKLFTDANGNLVRARCGNRLSNTPRTPIEFTPPPDLDTPRIDISIEFPPELPPSFTLPPADVPLPPYPVLTPVPPETLAPPEQHHRRRWFAFIPLIWGGAAYPYPSPANGPVVIPVAVPVATPEPSTWFLALFTLIVIGAGVYRKRRG